MLTKLKPVIFAIVVLAMLALSGCGGDGESPTPTPTSSEPEAIATSSPTSLPPDAPPAWRTVTAPGAPGVGRTDCPEGWLAYADPQDRFSICYPSDFSASASDFALNANGPLDSETGTGLGVVLSWSERAGYFYGPPSPETCPNYTGIVEGPLSSEFVQVPISGRLADACFTVGPIQSSLHGTIPLAADGSEREGFVDFMLNFIAEDLSIVPPEGKAILDTLAVEFR